MELQLLFLTTQSCHVCTWSSAGGSNTSHYYTRGNDTHFNRTLLSMLRTLSEEQKGDWKNHLPRSHTHNEATGLNVKSAQAPVMDPHRKQMLMMTVLQ